MATRAQQWYEGLLNDYRSKYLRVADQVIRTGEASDRTWDRFENSTEEVLKAADLIAAAKIQWKTKRQRIIVPDKKNVTIDDIIKHNPWYAEHARKTHRQIKQVSKSIRRIEKRYYTKNAEHLQARPQTLIPQSRLTLFSRNAIGDVAETSQQVVLSDPEIGPKLPYAQYFTRDDRRVRPNHFWMYGFVALRSWDGWKIIRPKTGWSCRCFTIFRSLGYAIEQGWAYKNGRPRWEAKWPNAQSKRNYERKVFPDPGWRGPKPWA